MLRYDRRVGDVATWADRTWTDFLGLLQKIIIPDWSDVINALPILFVLGLLGPILTLLGLLWLRYRFTRRTGRVRLADPAPVPAERDEDGYLIVPPSTPFCARDGLLYPPNATRCESCREELVVRCPVDSTTRTARQQVCRACGTRYVLGASTTAVAVRRSGGPPEGGAAVA
jgi:hypothetical protein